MPTVIPANPQRVALADVKGDKAFITREWLRLITELADAVGGGSDAGGTGSSFDPATLLGLINALTLRVAALEAEVRRLRLGYQA